MARHTKEPTEGLKGRERSDTYSLIELKLLGFAYAESYWNNSTK